MQFGTAIAKRFMGTWRLYLDWSFGGKLIYIRFGNMFPNHAAISTQFGTAIAKWFMGTWRLFLCNLEWQSRSYVSKSRSDFYAILNGNHEAIFQNLVAIFQNRVAISTPFWQYVLKSRSNFYAIWMSSNTGCIALKVWNTDLSYTASIKTQDTVIE